jgi:alkylation response protein AidB-like acyl-CoA dehydrogenase
MDFGFSEEQEMLRESCQQFLAQEIPLLRAREIGESGSYDRKLWSQIAELGWTALTIPEENDGLGLGLVDLLVLAEEHGRLCQPGPLLATTQVATVLGEFGSDAQRSRWLTPIGLGECIATWAHYEADGGWASEDVALEAKADGDGLILNGTKRLVHDAVDADLLLVSFRGADGPGLALVPTTAAGVKVRAHTGLDLTRQLAEVVFEGVRVESDAVLPAGVEAIDRALQIAVVLQCGENLGVAETLLEMTVEYAKEREQFGRPIGSFQAIRHKCANMRVALDGIRSLTRYAALAVQDRLDDVVEAVHAAKAHTGEATSFIAGEALQIHGGVGFTWEYDVHILLRRAKSNEALYGDPAWHNERVAAGLEASRKS